MSVVDRIHDEVKNGKKKKKKTKLCFKIVSLQKPIKKKSPGHWHVGSPVMISDYCGLCKDSRKPEGHLAYVRKGELLRSGAGNPAGPQR